MLGIVMGPGTLWTVHRRQSSAWLWASCDTDELKVVQVVLGSCAVSLSSPTVSGMAHVVCGGRVGWMYVICLELAS